jgi:hypothetical protein
MITLYVMLMDQLYSSATEKMELMCLKVAFLRSSKNLKT